MKVQFKGSAQSFDCSEPVEQKIFKSGVSIGWAIMFHINADVTSSDIDGVVTPDSISELTFTNDNGATSIVTGYSNVTACVIRHKNNATVVEVQFTKISEHGKQTGTEEGVVENGQIQESD